MGSNVDLWKGVGSYVCVFQCECLETLFLSDEKPTDKRSWFTLIHSLQQHSASWPYPCCRDKTTHTHTKKISPEIRRHESNVHVPLLNRSACVPQSDKSSFKERCQKKELVSFGMSSFFSHWKKNLKNGFMGQSLKLFKCLLWHLFVWVSTVCQFGVLFSRGKWQVSAHHSSKH